MVNIGAWAGVELTNWLVDGARGPAPTNPRLVWGEFMGLLNDVRGALLRAANGGANGAVSSSVHAPRPKSAPHTHGEMLRDTHALPTPRGYFGAHEPQ